VIPPACAEGHGGPRGRAAVTWELGAALEHLAARALAVPVTRPTPDEEQCVAASA
jgi:hypothetical protein